MMNIFINETPQCLQLSKGQLKHTVMLLLPAHSFLGYNQSETYIIYFRREGNTVEPILSGPLGSFQKECAIHLCGTGSAGYYV